jgi:hypothetical protein
MATRTTASLDRQMRHSVAISPRPSSKPLAGIGGGDPLHSRIHQEIQAVEIDGSHAAAGFLSLQPTRLAKSHMPCTEAWRNAPSFCRYGPVTWVNGQLTLRPHGVDIRFSPSASARGARHSPVIRKPTMPDHRVVSDFVALVESGEYVEAIQRFYHPEAVVWENQRQSRVGMDALIENEQRVLKAFHAVNGRATTVMVDGDRVVISWRFEFVNGDSSVWLDEVAMQQWFGGKIVNERFYYDPAQLHPVSGQPIDAGSTQEVGAP